MCDFLRLMQFHSISHTVYKLKIFIEQVVYKLQHFQVKSHIALIEQLSVSFLRIDIFQTWTLNLIAIPIYAKEW